jgi:hypothetical protein
MGKSPHPNNPIVRNPDWAKTIFEQARQPRAWLAQARRLRKSAEIIFDQENQVADRFYGELRRDRLRRPNGTALSDFDEAKFPPPNFEAGYLLIGTAIENLLKGLIVAKGLVTFSPDKLPGDLKTHDLKKLRNRATPMAAVPAHLLDSLTYMVKWRARYPLPSRLADFWPMRDDGTFKTPGFSWPDSISDILAYCDNLEAELQSLF